METPIKEINGILFPEEKIMALHTMVQDLGDQDIKIN